MPVLAPVPLTESGVALQRLGPVASTTAAGTILVLLVAFAVQLLRRTGPYSSHGAGAEGQPLPNPLALLHRRDGLPQLAELACALAAAQIACVLFAVSYVVEGLGKSHGEAIRAPIQIVALQPASQPAREAVGENGISP